jgi:hypothetical protein
MSHRFRLRPLFSWRLRFASRRSGGQVLADQTLVGQPLAHDGARDVGKSPTVVFLPMVEAKALLVQIAVHVERVNADVGAFDGALEQAPERLQAIGVNQPNSISLSMVNDLMVVGLLESDVGRQRVGVENGTFLDVGANPLVHLSGLDALDNFGADGRMLAVLALIPVLLMTLARFDLCMNLDSPPT